MDGHESGALVLDQPEGLVEPLVVEVRGGQPEEHAVRVVRGQVGKVLRKSNVENGTAHMKQSFADNLLRQGQYCFCLSLEQGGAIKELETTRKALLSPFHSLIFGITQLDSRRGK